MTLTLDGLTHYAQSGAVIIAFLAAMGAAMGWLYRKVFRPVHVSIARILELTEYELQPNGGGSLVDKVTHIGHRIDTVEKRLEKIELATGTPKEIP